MYVDDLDGSGPTTKTRDGGGLGAEDEATLTKFLGGCAVVLLVVGYGVYKLIMWLSTQTS